MVTDSLDYEVVAYSVWQNLTGYFHPTAESSVLSMNLEVDFTPEMTSQRDMEVEELMPGTAAGRNESKIGFITASYPNNPTQLFLSESSLLNFANMW